ncbi:hypothetical protein ACSSNL_00850 [Thalassobius sp. S69A]|uniref:hypothetical protein n=1 Tax=unclassified Thalassovita TaxID=2619711 RepID=UPI003C7B4977|tara:strand:+ start:325 stop:486 length:162 start_codon:yes stop_codon:yes gene_type:complete
MFEATATARTRDALQKAHAERAAAFRWLVGLVFRAAPESEFPLGARALTGSSR